MKEHKYYMYVQFIFHYTILHIRFNCTSKVEKFLEKHVIREPWITGRLLQSSNAIENPYTRPKNHVIHTQFKHSRYLYNSLKFRAPLLLEIPK